MAYLDDYEEEEKKGFPFKIVAIVVAILVVLGIAGITVVSLVGREEPEPETDTGTETTTVVENDDQSDETESDITITTDEPEEDTTETDLTEGGADDVTSQEPEQRLDGPEFKSSAIPMEEKMKMVEDNDIDEETEKKYAQYGALNIDQMRDVATRWTNEWAAMVNDTKWDEHSTVLKSLMDQSYVNNHGSEFEVMWLYECLHDTLYVSSESMLFKDIQEVRIINSVPSPLTYMSIVVNVDQQSPDGATPGTVTYKMALNRNYQVCKFHVSY